MDSVDIPILEQFVKFLFLCSAPAFLGARGPNRNRRALLQARWPAEAARARGRRRPRFEIRARAGTSLVAYVMRY